MYPSKLNRQELLKPEAQGPGLCGGIAHSQTPVTKGNLQRFLRDSLRVTSPLLFTRCRQHPRGHWGDPALTWYEKNENKKHKVNMLTQKRAINSDI